MSYELGVLLVRKTNASDGMCVHADTYAKFLLLVLLSFDCFDI